jgi:hypothetical protein
MWAHFNAVQFEECCWEQTLGSCVILCSLRVGTRIRGGALVTLMMSLKPREFTDLPEKKNEYQRFSSLVSPLKHSA